MGRGARGCPSHQDKHQRCRILDLNISLCCFHLQPLRAGEVWDALKLHAPCTKEVLQGKERSRGRRRREQRKKKKGGCTKLITTSCPSRDGGIPDACLHPQSHVNGKNSPGLDRPGPHVTQSGQAPSSPKQLPQLMQSTSRELKRAGAEFSIAEATRC